MQNRYVGDIGDFGKFGLLRYLSGATDPEGPEPRLRVGLIWYLHHDERHGTDKSKINSDGRHTSYLDLTRKNVRLYGNRDPELWSKLGHLVGQDRRCVHCAEEARLLPDDTLYYDPLLAYFAGMPQEQKVAIRECWMRNALKKMEGADLVCVDPDNGLTPQDTNQVKYDPARGTKYVYMDDLREIWKAKHSIVAYHHSNRDGKVPVQMERVVARIHEAIGADPIPLWFHGGTARAFFVIPQPGNKGDIIRCRVRRFLDAGWEHPQLFERVGQGDVINNQRREAMI